MAIRRRPFDRLRIRLKVARGAPPSGASANPRLARRTVSRPAASFPRLGTVAADVLSTLLAERILGNVRRVLSSRRHRRSSRDIVAMLWDPRGPRAQERDGRVSEASERAVSRGSGEHCPPFLQRHDSSSFPLPSPLVTRGRAGGAADRSSIVTGGRRSARSREYLADILVSPPRGPQSEVPAEANPRGHDDDRPNGQDFGLAESRLLPGRRRKSTPLSPPGPAVITCRSSRSLRERSARVYRCPLGNIWRPRKDGLFGTAEYASFWTWIPYLFNYIMYLHILSLSPEANHGTRL